MNARAARTDGFRPRGERRRRRGRVLVLGVGNPLLGDDGIGAAAIHRLRQEPLPRGVEVFDAGTSTIDVLADLARFERVIVIDAVRAAGAVPGTVVEFDLATAEVEGAGPAFSAHEFELGGLKALAAALGVKLPPVHVVGLVPVEVELGQGLSPAGMAALGPIVERVLRLVRAGPGPGAGRPASQPRPA